MLYLDLLVSETLTGHIVDWTRQHLTRTWPGAQDNPELGLVQARWSFVNKDENLLTRLQNINLCFHFEVEQQVNGVYLNFFGFNGTAGVWRIKALEDSGGWMERTTVEDMDIAVRAHLCGWKFIFLNDVKVYIYILQRFNLFQPPLLLDEEMLTSSLVTRTGPVRAAGVIRGLPEAAAPVALRPHAALPSLPPSRIQVQGIKACPPLMIICRRVRED
jgi:hypothetical protein